MKIKFQFIESWGEFYIYPSISITYDYYINGCYSLNVKFLGRGFSIDLYKKDV